MNSPNKVQIKIQCVSCQKVFFSPMPQLEIANNLFVSVITAAHEKLTKCNRCHQHYVLTILITEQAQVAWQAIPVPDDVVEKVNGTKLVVPEIQLVG